MTENQQKIRIDLHQRQTQAMDAIDRLAKEQASKKSPQTAEVLYGGAKGGGKSVFGCVWCYNEAIQIIQRFKLQPTKYPIPLAFMGRKQSVDFTNTTLETWKKMIPPNNYTIRSQDKEIIIKDTVKLCYGGFDRSETVNKFNSGEFAYYFVDQAEELTLDDMSLLRGTLRLKINNTRLEYKGLLSANPRQCWLKDEFILQKHPARQFIQALPSDNPHLAAGYVERLADAFKHRPELLEAYLHGSWDSVEGADQLISEKNIRAAMLFRFYSPVITFISCDPARMGDDETVIYIWHNTTPIAQKIYGKLTSDRLQNLLHVLALEHKATHVVIEEDGLGGPIVDHQRKISAGKYQVIGITSGSGADDSDKYFNKRAEVYCDVSDRFAAGEISLDIDWMPDGDRQTLISQLCTPTYDFRGSKILIEAKDSIKKRISRSPDRADAFVLGQYIYPQLRRQSKDNPNATSRKPKKKRSTWAA